MTPLKSCLCLPAAAFLLLAAAAAPSSASSRLPALCSLERPPPLTFSEDYDPGRAPPVPDFLSELLAESSPHLGGRSAYINSENFVQEVAKVDDLEQTVRMPIFSIKSW